MTSASGVAPAERGEALVRKLTRLMRIAILGLILCAVLDLVAIGFDVSYQHLVDRLIAGTFVSPSDAQSADDRQTAIGVVQLLVALLTAIPFIAWFREAYTNVGRLGIQGLRFSRGWTIGAWFVPILNFARPKAIADDIWRGSDPRLPAHGSFTRAPVPWFFNVWWGAFLASWILGRIAFNIEQGSDSASTLSSANKLLMTSDVAELLAAILAIVVVYRTTGRQWERAAAVTQATPVEPAGHVALVQSYVDSAYPDAYKSGTSIDETRSAYGEGSKDPG